MSDTNTSLFLTSGFSCALLRDIAREEFHQQNEIEVAFIEKGVHNVLSGGRLIANPERRVVISWAIVPHRSVVVEGAPAQGYVVNLPLAWFLSRTLPPRFVTAVMHGRLLFDPQPGRHIHDSRLFRGWHADINSGSDERRSIALLEIEARLRRLAFELEATGAMNDEAGHQPLSGENASELSKIEQMTAFVAMHYRKPLKMGDIARAVGLHENYAMQIFRHTTGATLLQYLIRHRLWHAQRLLATSDLPMVEVARQTGFGSDSQFYIVFKRHYNISPRAYRESVRKPSRLPADSGLQGM